ncbi:MAG: hypothetical protein U0703_23055 [Anaerolineae bacterium]
MAYICAASLSTTGAGVKEVQALDGQHGAAGVGVLVHALNRRHSDVVVSAAGAIVSAAAICCPPASCAGK